VQMGLFKKRESVPPPEWSQDQQTLLSVGLSPVQPIPSSLTAHSDFIKRATCVRCGAMKKLPSKTAYLYCDFCGALVDYDFRIANAGTNAGITNTVFSQLVAPYQMVIVQAKAAGDRDAYRGIMLHVFHQWIERCPQAVSPRAKTDRAFREKLVTYFAETFVCKDMDPWQMQMDTYVNGLIAQFQRVPQPGGAWLVSGDFWTVAAAWKQQMDAAYAAIEASGVAALDPDEPPPGVALKMEYSTFCQTWLPHLSTEDGERLLAEYGMKGDYTKVEQVETESHRCGGCGVELQTVVGARVVVCEDCGYRIDISSGEVPCNRCGAPLSLLAGVSQVNCPYCQTTTARV